MRKLVAMVLALCMVMCCVPAFATLTLPEIPPTMADVSGAERPEMPAYTLDVVDGHYVLTIDGVDGNVPVMGGIHGYNEDGQSQYVSLFWNEDRSAIVSGTLLDDEHSDFRQMSLYIDKADGSGYTVHDVNLDTGVQFGASDGNWSDDGDCWYSWYDEYNEFTYRYGDKQDNYVDITYNLTTGSVRGYSLEYNSGLSVGYNRFGKIVYGTWRTEDGFYWWDERNGRWGGETDGDETIPELPLLTAENYPAPYAEPYVVARPSATVDGLDLDVGDLAELEDGSYLYWSDTIEAAYDVDGNLEYYSYSNMEGNTAVQYGADDVLQWACIWQPDGGYYWYSHFNGWSYTDADGNETMLEEAPEGLLDGMDPLPDPNAPDDAVEYIWYDNNTVGLVGLSLRDMGVTDKWYNVVPVDLTQDGVQVLDLVGSNLFHIGKAYVTVQDGQVTVDYELFPGQGYLKDECVQWFTALEDITTDFLSNPASDVAFGQALSIAEDLGGAETAILFICNHVTYRQPYNGDNGYLSRYWPNRQRWIDYRAELTELLEGMNK